MNDILQKAIAQLGGDISSAVQFSPLGEAAIRSLYAQSGVGPGPWDQAKRFPGAVSTASMGLMPKVVGAGGAIGGLAKGVMNAQEGKPLEENALASVIQGIRNTAQYAPLLPMAKEINAAKLRMVPRDGGLPQYKMQTLIQNILSKLKKH